MSITIYGNDLVTVLQSEEVAEHSQINVSSAYWLQVDVLNFKLEQVPK